MSSLPPGPAFCGGGSIPYTVGDVGNVVSALMQNLYANSFHSIHIVTENVAGTLLDLHRN